MQLSEKYSPWEDWGNIGILNAFFKTLAGSLFKPAAFFSEMPVAGGFGKPLLFGLILGEIGWITALMWQGLFSFIPFALNQGTAEDLGLSMAFIVGLTIFSPFLVVFGLFIGTAIFHVCLFLVGGARNGFEATFRVACYASSAQILNLIPICGGIVGALWAIVLYIIGINEAHNISGGRAAIAVFLPLLICCAFAILIIMSAGFFSEVQDVMEF